MASLEFGTLGRAATLDLRFSAPNEPCFDRLGIFSDVTDVKITLTLLFRRRTHFSGAGSDHTESVTEIAIRTLLLPRSLIAVSCHYTKFLHEGEWVLDMERAADNCSADNACNGVTP